MANAASAIDVAPSLGIFYASQTGNGESVARSLAERVVGTGRPIELKSFDRLRPAQLRRQHFAVFVISTHGDGDPPDDALELFEFLAAERTGALDGLRFRILALGDSSYAKYCEAGRQLEALLLARGARAFAERVECDLDFETPAERFSGEVTRYVESELDQVVASAAAEPVPVEKPHLTLVQGTTTWDRRKPFPATVESVSPLTSAGSGKTVRHIVLSLAGSGISYEPGDSFGLRAVNDPELVSEIIRALRLDPAERVEYEGKVRSLRDWLGFHRDITRLAPQTLHALAGLSRSPALKLTLERLGEAGLPDFMARRQLADVVDEFPLEAGAAELVSLLRPLATRSYSVASSRALVGDQVELTVVTHENSARGATRGPVRSRRRRGVASDFLNHRLQPGDDVGLFLEANPRFHLPEDRSTPLILIGAGTGIAPFRAMFQQFEAEGRAPRSWLIFGNPRARHDFLYQLEWLAWRRDGLLDRIDTAFSRDQADKRYVQHVVADKAPELLTWLDWGAHVYICGALAMGRAVEAALQQAIVRERGLPPDAAARAVADLRREGRLKKDLY